MLIHITPKLFANRQHMPEIELVDLSIPELGLVLTGGKELVSKRPYPNKNYVVARRKMGQRSVVGICIDTVSHVNSFTSVARWAINAEVMVTHRTHYVVLDEEFDTVSDDMTSWGAFSASLGGYRSRCPAWVNNSPMVLEPLMSVLADDGHRKGAHVNDVYGARGLITERHETFRLPTVERGRLEVSCSDWFRKPNLEMAFKSTV